MGVAVPPEFVPAGNEGLQILIGQPARLAD